MSFVGGGGIPGGAGAGGAGAGAGGAGGAGVGAEPANAQVVRAVLKSIGIEEWDPEVVPQMMEFMERHVSEVLEDAVCYQDHRREVGQASEISEEDVRLAVKSKTAFGWSQMPPRELLMELAHARNSIPLGEMVDVTKNVGLKLPPEKDTLLQKNFRLF